MRPRDVRKDEDFLKLKSDNFPQNTNRWSILVHEDHVSLHAPLGEGFVRITHSQFAPLVDWYNRDQKTRKKR